MHALDSGSNHVSGMLARSMDTGGVHEDLYHRGIMPVGVRFLTSGMDMLYILIGAGRR